MTEAILMFSQQSSVIRGDRKLQVRSHWILQLLMVICSLGGLLAIYMSKEERGKAHYTSWHGLLGLITVISCCSQALAGIVLIYPTLIKRFISLAQLKIYHAVYGLFNYTLVTIVLNLAMRSNWATKNITGAAWYGCIACIDVLALVVMTQVTNSTLPRMRRQRQWSRSTYMNKLPASSLNQTLIVDRKFIVNHDKLIITQISHFLIKVIG